VERTEVVALKGRGTLPQSAKKAAKKEREVVPSLETGAITKVFAESSSIGSEMPGGESHEKKILDSERRKISGKRSVFVPSFPSE
jgi:hypothetical protein